MTAPETVHAADEWEAQGERVLWLDDDHLAYAMFPAGTDENRWLRSEGDIADARRWGATIFETVPHPDDGAGGRILRDVPDVPVSLVAHLELTAEVDKLRRSLDDLQSLGALFATVAKVLNGELRRD